MNDNTLQLPFHHASSSVEQSHSPDEPRPDPLILQLSPTLQLHLATDVGPGCGGRTWPAGMVLASYLLTSASLSNVCSVLELGSGTGLVGLLASLILSHSRPQPPAHVYITDQIPMLALMHKNISLNNLGNCVSALQLDWGDPLPEEITRNPPQLILAADCVYFEPAFPLLVHTLKDLTNTNSPEILFCYKKRRKADRRFFLLLKKDFAWVEVEDHPDKESYKREAISLMRVTRRRPKTSISTANAAI